LTLCLLLALGRGKDPDAVRGGQLGQAGGVGRDGVGQAQVEGRLAGCCHELVESAWCGDDDDPARAGLPEVEAVRDAVRHEHERTGVGLPQLVSAESLEVAVQDEECFIGSLMEVGWRREPGGDPVIDDAQLAVAVGGGHLVDGQGVQEPERLALVLGEHEAACGDTGAGIHLLLLGGVGWVCGGFARAGECQPGYDRGDHVVAAGRRARRVRAARCDRTAALISSSCRSLTRWS
jgi:hypothetical protein